MHLLLLFFSCDHTTSPSGTRGRGKKGKRRSRSDGNGGRQGGDRARKLNERRKAVVLDGPKRGSPELHGWKLAMLELAGRYSVEVRKRGRKAVLVYNTAVVTSIWIALVLRYSNIETYKLPMIVTLCCV